MGLSASRRRASLLPSAVARSDGRGGDNLVPTLLPYVSDAEIVQFSEERGSIYKDRHLSQVRPFPGARALLEHCHEAGISVVLATSGKGNERDHYLDLLDAHGFVDAGTTSDDVAHSKPCPDIFNEALRKVGVKASESLVIGDTPYDIEAAKAAGIVTVAVRSGGFSDQQLSDAVAIYDDVAAILADFDHSPLANGYLKAA